MVKFPVFIFGLSSFLNDLGSDMIQSIWPIFITTVLNANMAVLGLIDGLGNALVSVSQAFSGYFSDYIGKRKVFVWLGYCFGGLSRVGYALSPSWRWLIPFKVLDRCGKIRDAPRDAIVSDLSKYKRGWNFGFLRMMDHLGAASGVILGVVLLMLIPVRSIFLLAALPSLISALSIIFFIKEGKSKVLFNGFNFNLLSNTFKIFLLVSCLFALANLSYSFFIIRALDIGFTPLLTPLFYLLFTIVASFFSIPFGRLADKIGCKPVISISYLFFFIACFGFAFLNSSLLIFPLFIIYGLFLASFEPAVKSFIAGTSYKIVRASSIGTFRMLTGLIAFPASFIAGLLWEFSSSSAPFLFAASLSFICLLLLPLVK